MSRVDPRWSLLTNGTDTLVQGPYREFVQMGANRMVADNIITNATLRIAEMGKINRSCEAEVIVKDEVIVRLNKRLRDQSETLGNTQLALIASNNRNEALKSWATIGKVATITFTVGAGVGIVVLAKQALGN